jgi:hypothetical protein
MDRLRVTVDEHGLDDLGMDLEDEELYAERGGRGFHHHGLPRIQVGTEERRGSGWGDRERDREFRSERSLREGNEWERRARDEFSRRRDSGVDVDAFRGSNPFNPRPGLGRRTMTAPYAGGYDFAGAL